MRIAAYTCVFLRILRIFAYSAVLRIAYIFCVFLFRVFFAYFSHFAYFAYSPPPSCIRPSSFFPASPSFPFTLCPSFLRPPSSSLFHPPPIPPSAFPLSASLQFFPCSLFFHPFSSLPLPRRPPSLVHLPFTLFLPG